MAHVKNFHSNGNFKFDEVADSIGDSNIQERADTPKVDDVTTSDVDIGGNKDSISSTVNGDSVRTRPIREHKLPDRFKDFVLT